MCLIKSLLVHTPFWGQIIGDEGKRTSEEMHQYHSWKAAHLFDDGDVEDVDDFDRFVLRRYYVMVTYLVSRNGGDMLSCCRNPH